MRRRGHNCRKWKRLKDGQCRLLHEMQNGMCPLCARPMDPTGPEPLNIDHIMPRTWGGSDSFFNKQLVHARCNTAKRSAQQHPLKANYEYVPAIWALTGKRIPPRQVG